MIPITATLAIDEAELVYESIRSGGPGGQNVNKVATAVQLRFDVRRSPSLPEAVRLRLERLAGKRLNDEGVLLLRAERFRTQEQNRADALARLVALIQAAAVAPRPRHKTRPTRASQEKRLAGKRRDGGVKRLRREQSDEE